MKKKQGKYSGEDTKAEKRASKRKYMSYEDVPLEDYREPVPVQGNVTKKFLKLFLILFFAVVLVIALMNIDKLTPDNIAHWFQYDLLGKTEGTGYPVSISGTTVDKENFGLINGMPIYCSDTSITVLNRNAGTYQENQHSYAKPVLSVDEGYALVYNIDATGYTILKRDTVEKTDSVSQKIIAGDIASNGVYALLTESDDYLAKLTVYRSDHKEKYTYSFADYYMSSVSINRDGNRAIVSGVSARSGGLISVIYILDFTQDSYLQKYEADDTFIYDVMFFNNGNAAAVGDDTTFFINVNDGKKTDYSYESRTLTGYSLNRSHGVLLSVSDNPDGRECAMFPIDKNGESSKEIATGKKILAMDWKGNDVAALYDGLVVIYDREGTKKAEAAVDSDVRKIVCPDEAFFYALGKTRISKVTP